MRKTLLSFLALALFAALPALAAPAVPPPATQPALAPPAAAPAALGCQAAAASPFASLAPAVPEWMAISNAASKKFHGFCRCGCSNVPDCNTDADCGGSVGSCSQFISCC